MAGRFGSWYTRWNTTLIKKLGPSQIGAGHPEAPDDRRVDRACPICGAPLSEHRVDRPSGQYASSTLHCPGR